MSNIARWTGGNLESSVWGGALFGSSDLNGLANGDSILSSLSDWDNTGTPDTWLDANIELTIASNTIAAGAYIGLYIAYLIEDGSHYGDNQFTTATGASAAVPSWQPFGIIQVPALSSTTAIRGASSGIILRKKFRMLLTNNCGFALASSGAGNVYFDTSDINLNG